MKKQNTFLLHHHNVHLVFGNWFRLLSLSEQNSEHCRTLTLRPRNEYEIVQFGKKKKRKRKKNLNEIEKN